MLFGYALTCKTPPWRGGGHRRLNYSRLSPPTNNNHTLLQLIHGLFLAHCTWSVHKMRVPPNTVVDLHFDGRLKLFAGCYEGFPNQKTVGLCEDYSKDPIWGENHQDITHREELVVMRFSPMSDRRYNSSKLKKRCLQLVFSPKNYAIMKTIHLWSK